MIDSAVLKQAVEENVKQALAEDIGSGDITAQLIPASTQTLTLFVRLILVFS